jgi:RimJ/RimL family protein N-acetyltransferase
MSAKVSLQPVGAGDLERLVSFFTEPGLAGEFQWFGYRFGRAEHLRRRWAEDGLVGAEESFLAVMVEGGVCAGWVGWRPAGPQGNHEIGAALFPEHRERGVGTEAQRLLVGYLLATTTAHRIQAGTEADNLAEQRALEKVGFVREGVMKGAYFRDGCWRDSVMYGLTRDMV